MRKKKKMEACVIILRGMMSLMKLKKKKKYVRFWTLIAQYIKPFDGLTILYQKFKPSIPLFNYIVKYEIF